MLRIHSFHWARCTFVQCGQCQATPLLFVNHWPSSRKNLKRGKSALDQTWEEIYGNFLKKERWKTTPIYRLGRAITRTWDRSPAWFPPSDHVFDRYIFRRIPWANESIHCHVVPKKIHIKRNGYDADDCYWCVWVDINCAAGICHSLSDCSQIEWFYQCFLY